MYKVKRHDVEKTVNKAKKASYQTLRPKMRNEIKVNQKFS